MNDDANPFESSLAGRTISEWILIAVIGAALLTIVILLIAAG